MALWSSSHFLWKTRLQVEKHIYNYIYIYYILYIDIHSKYVCILLIIITIVINVCVSLHVYMYTHIGDSDMERKLMGCGSMKPCTVFYSTRFLSQATSCPGRCARRGQPSAWHVVNFQSMPFQMLFIDIHRYLNEFTVSYSRSQELD